MFKLHYDVIIVGAGLSGIGHAYWLKQKCPTKKFIVLESRDKIGGTWSLFNYPGIRSDSDMFTFGYRFQPWSDPKSLSSGESIYNYLKETIDQHELEPYFKFNHRMVSANWSSVLKSWTLEVETPEGKQQILCDFLSMCSGYYDYKKAHIPDFDGYDKFKGKIVIPQFWPKELDYSDKKIAVIGSGATAVTIVPNMAKKGAAHVTMVQRSPTYIVNLPNRNKIFLRMKKVFPLKWAYRVTRIQNILLQMLSFRLSKSYPKWMKSKIMGLATRQLPDDFPVEKHLNPTYNPWDQRLCVVPDGDLFKSIRNGKCSIETGTISNFTEDGIIMKSGNKVEADIIVVATGLKLQLLGGSQLSLNGEPVDVADLMVYKGMMISGLPNFTYAFGYTNSSWTLKVDLTANFLCKMINFMDKNYYSVVVPNNENEVSEENFLNLNSGYIERAKKILPKQGSKRPWKVYQNYLMDMLSTRFGSVRNKVLKFH